VAHDLERKLDYSDYVATPDDGKRYEIVQGLVRVFRPSADDADPFSERMTVRPSLLESRDREAEPLEWALRPLYRAGERLAVQVEGGAGDDRRVPLRAWYPIEVFRYPVSGVFDSARIEAGLADGSLVVDTRLRDALATDIFSFPVPSIVDDSSHAIECAAVGEVDLVRLDRQIRDLELRLAELEARFWPRVRQRLRRIAGRPS